MLVHAAAGGAGSAAVQLANARGATVLATAGTDEKVTLCSELGADVAVNYETEDFVAVVLRETGGRGVDVVFDNVGEAVFEGSLKCTAYNGRYLMMGFASNKTVADEPFVVPRRVALGHRHDHVDPGLRRIKQRHERQLLTTGGLKLIARAHPNLL